MVSGMRNLILILPLLLTGCLAQNETLFDFCERTCIDHDGPCSRLGLTTTVDDCYESCGAVADLALETECVDSYVEYLGCLEEGTCNDCPEEWGEHSECVLGLRR